jgi:hypothetical protein
MGMDPKGFGYRVFDSTFGPRFFRRWAAQSIDALGVACEGSSSARGAASGGA